MSDLESLTTVAMDFKLIDNSNLEDPTALEDRIQVYGTFDNQKNNLNEELDIRLFPNPATEAVNIQLSTNVLNGKIRLYDTVGRLIFEKDILEGQLDYQIKTNLLPKGLFYLKIENEEIIKAKKLILK